MNKKYIKIFALSAVSFFLINIFYQSIFLNINAQELASHSDNIIYEKNMENYTAGHGINYYKKQLKIRDNGSYLNESLNILEADFNNENLKIITSKGQDTVQGAETLTAQIQSAVQNGNNVVGGINGDMFWTKDFTPTGPQVQNGNLLVSYLAKYQEKMLPVFIIDKQGLPSIQNLEFNGYLSDDLDNKFFIDTVNRNAQLNKIQIFTQQYNTSKKIDISSLGSSAVFFVIQCSESRIKLGNNIIGNVKKVIKNSKTYSIKNDEIVVAASKDKADILQDNFKEGSYIQIYCNFNKDNIDQAIGSYTYLVKDGKKLSADDMVSLGAEKTIINSKGKARTALGITADNKVICITVDAGQKAYGISDGVTLPQMAEIMAGYNVINAISFDGGGSTQMNVRKFGDENCSFTNAPSYGFQRKISNAVLLVDKSLPSNVVGEISIGKDIEIYSKNVYKFNINAIDTNYYPCTIDVSKVKWSCDSKIGTIDKNGVFTAKCADAEGYVSAEIDGVKDKAKVQVFKNIPVLSFADSNNVYLSINSKKQFTVKAKDKLDNEIIMNNKDDVKWKITGNIGKIISNGKTADFTAANRFTSGKITAYAGNKNCTANIIIRRPYTVVDDFENKNYFKYSVGGYVGGNGNLSTEQHKSGKYSYKVTYDYSKKWKRVNNGTIDINPLYINKAGISVKDKFVSLTQPKKLGMWVYGDGKAPWMRAIISDNKGKTYTINFVNRVTWKGWRFVQAEIPEEITSAVLINKIYFVEINKDSNNKGCIYIDDIRFMY